MPPPDVAVCGYMHLASLSLPGSEDQHSLAVKQLAAVGMKWFKKQQFGAGIAEGHLENIDDLRLSICEFDEASATRNSQ